jgi:hypothetical protein
MITNTWKAWHLAIHKEETRQRIQRLKAEENLRRNREIMAQIQNRPDDGNDGSHYEVVLPEGSDHGGVISASDIVEALNLNHAMGEAFCAIWRMGKKPGEKKSRALRKVIYYAERQLKIELEKESI